MVQFEMAEYTSRDYAGLLEMYRRWDPLQHSQGLPPVRSDLRVKWLDLLTSRGLNAVARSADEVVGHAVLMPDQTGSWELCVESGGRSVRCCARQGFQKEADDGWQQISRVSLSGHAPSRRA
jgi:hypothetical protein